MADKDVRLIIRARNDASKEIKNASDAMAVLEDATKDASAETKTAASVYARLGQELKRLSSQNTAANALGKISEFMASAATAASRLQGEAAGLKKALDSTGAATAKAKAETDGLRQAYDALKAVYAQQKAAAAAATKATNNQSEAYKAQAKAARDLAKAKELSDKNPEKSARIETASADVARTSTAYSALVEEQTRLAAVAKASREQLGLLNAQVNASETNFRKLTTESQKLESAVARIDGELASGEAAMAEMSAMSEKVATSLGLVSTAEGKLESETKSLIPQIGRLESALAAIQKFSKGNGQFVDPKTASAFQRQRIEVEKAQGAWKGLEAVTRDMARELRATAQPTEAQALAFKDMAAASRAAKAEYDAQVAALGRLQGAATKTFAEFSEGAGRLRSLNADYQANVAGINALTAAIQRYTSASGRIGDASSTNAIRQQSAIVDQARARYQLLTAEVAKLTGNMRGSQGATAATQRELLQVARAANEAGKEFREASNALRQLETTGSAGGSFFGRMNSDTRQTLSLYQRLRGEVLSLAAAYVGLYGAISGVGGVVASYQKIEAAQNRLGVVFKQNAELTRNELSFLERQAARLGIEFGTLSAEYSKFAISAQAANFSGEETRKVFLSVAEAARVNKLSLQDTQGVFLALTQMIQKGRVSSDELRQQLGERLPGAINIFADALGVTTEELSKMLEQGEVLANSDTMLKFADEMNKRFGPQLAESLRSLTTDIGAFFNNIFQAQLQFGKGGFLAAFQRGIENLNEYFTSREGRDFFLSLGAAAGKFVDILAVITENINLVVTAAQVLISVKIAQWIAGFLAGAVKAVQASRLFVQGLNQIGPPIQSATGATTGLGGAMVRLGIATDGATAKLLASAIGARGAGAAMNVLRGIVTGVATGFRVLFTALGGWIGVIATVVSFFATDLLGGWLGGVNDVTTALDEHQRQMGVILSAYEETTGAAKDWAKILKDLTLDQLDAQVGKLGDSFDSLKNDLVGGDIIPYKFWQSGIIDTASRVNELNARFRKGEIDVKAYTKELGSIYKDATSADAKEFLQTQLDTARKLEEVSTALDEAKDAANRKRDAVDGLRGTLETVETPLIRAAEASKTVEDAVDDGTLSLKEYKTALDEIKASIPSLADEMKRLGELDEFNAMFGNLKGGFNSITGEMARFGQRGYNEIRDSSRNFEAEYTAERGTPKGAQMEELIKATTILAEKMGVSAKDLLTAMSYETGGTLDPWKKGPTTQWGQHRGLIQWGEPQRQKYGVNADSSITDQVNAAGKYLEDAGVKAGDSLLQIYAAINAGNARKIHASDAGNGGAPGTVLDKVQGQMGSHEARAEALLKTYGGVVEQSKALVEEEKKQTEEKAKQALATKEALADGQFELEQADRKLAGKEREAAIEAAVRDAKAKNKDIDEASLETIRKQAGLLYDRQNALTAEEQKKKDIAAHDERINALETQRNALLEQRKIYEEQGNVEKLKETDASLAGINLQLTEAIDKAIAFQQALGGDKAMATIATLNATKLAIANTNLEGQKFALTATQMSEGIYSALDSGILNLFDTFAQAIANGEDAVGALWTAFRQFAANFLLQIAQMILKQTLFNALQGFSKALGGGLFNFTTMHSGGVVGASGVGSGSRAVHPSIFANAARYHGGGIAGLQPGEYPAVLKEGEEILTETNPRHIANQGAGGGPSGTKVVNLFDAASFLSEALNSPVGEEAILNHVRANPAAFKQALS